MNGVADERQADVRMSGLPEQLRALWPSFLLVGGIMLLLGAIILVVYVTTDVNVHHLVADSAEIAFLPEYTGLYSYFGILVLWSAAVVSVMTGLLARSLPSPLVPPALLVSFGVLIGALAVDDLFMLHESAGLLMAQAVGADDISFMRSRLEGIIFALIGVVWLVWLVRFRRTILSTEYLLLLAAVAGFGLSVAIDLSAYIVPALEPETQRMRTTLAVLEEMLKLAGILLMFAYAIRTCLPVLRSLAGRSSAP